MTEAYSQERPSDTATEYATFQFIVQSILSRVATASLVRVVACSNNGGLAPWGTVDVQPVITQLSGNNVAVQHGNLFKLPYLRMQGGTSAVILDPVPGDIGLAVFCSRDISSMKQQENIDKVKAGTVLGVPPASGRQYSMADGIYVGAGLNAQPTQFIQFSAEGIKVVSPVKIRLEAPEIEFVASSTVSVQAPTIDLEAATSATVDSPATVIRSATTIDGKPFLPHTHSGVTPGSSNSGGVT